MNVQMGKISDLGKDYRGWIIGSFVDKESPFNTKEEKKLSNKGDYIYYQPNVSHKSEALEDSTLIVFRWIK